VRTRVLKTAKMGISTPLKSDTYFRFLSETYVEQTAIPSHVQNLVQLGKG